ncbi:MAG: HU family DNA-binding protein [Candidatus Symbiothrix sp.]|jgi:nucleoid DNA-binding protein|nr:HU family DNA-binding protein [Candidatus Symbiothrix sp.]
MNEKLNIQDLASLLSEKSGISKKESELFLREFFETISDGLLSDQLVKIKNLGSFKLIAVSDRESVDVGSGQRMIIPAHYKVSFTPDTALADAVNEPFAFFEIIDLEDDNAEDSEETDQAIETLPTVEIPSKSQIETEATTPITTQIEEVPVELPDYDFPLIKPEPTGLSKLFHKHGMWNVIGCTIVLAIIVFLICLWWKDSYFPKQVKTSQVINTQIPDIADINSYEEPVVVEDTVPDTLPEDTTQQSIPNDTDVETTPIPEETVPIPVETTPAQEKRHVPQSGEQRHIVAPGETLRTIALSKYGNKVFWIYIYENNKPRISNPDHINWGTVLYLPPAAKYGIDANSPASIRKAKNWRLK